MTNYARRLGLFSGTMAVVGGIIGGGIFRTPATVAERLHSPSLVLVAWVIGGIVALIGAFCFGELGQRRPRAGGGYVYLRETFGPLPAFLYGWTLVLVIATGAIAAVAVTFADYTLALAGLAHTYSVPLAVAAIVFLTAINYVGVRPAAVTQNIFTVLKLAGLAVLIGAGVLLAAPSPPLAAPSPPPHLAALAPALVPIPFTSGGWQQTNFIAEGIVDPEKNLPKALLWGVAIVVTVYLLTNVAYLRVLGIEGLAQSTAPAADTMEALLGPVGGDRDFHVWVSEPRDSGDAARAAGDGRRRRVLSSLRRPASRVPDTDDCHRRPRRLRRAVDPDGKVRAARGFRNVRGLDLLWLDGGGTFRLPTT